MRLVVDATASMAHVDEGGAAARAAGEGGTPPSKLGYARMLAAALAFLALRQGDAVALHLVGEAAVDLPPLRRRRALERLLFHLETMEAGGRWPSWQQLGPRLLRPRRREVVVVMSDLWEAEAEIAAALAGLRALRHEVFLLHLIGRDELDFSWRGDVLFEDLESGAVVAGEAGALREAYLRRLGRLARRLGAPRAPSSASPTSACRWTGPSSWRYATCWRDGGGCGEWPQARERVDTGVSEWSAPRGRRRMSLDLAALRLRRGRAAPRWRRR